MPQNKPQNDQTTPIPSLEPCPFCGTVNPQITSAATGEYFIRCRGCRSTSDVFSNFHQAAFAWNRRNQAKPEQDYPGMPSYTAFKGPPEDNEETQP